MDYTNEFVIRGKVLGFHRVGARMAVELFTKAGKKESFPIIYCSEEMFKKSGIREGARMEIAGYIDVFYSKENGSYKRRQVLAATSIKKDKTICDDKFSVKGHFFNDCSSSVYLLGRYVSEDVRDDGWMSISICVSDKASDVVKVQMRKLANQPVFKKGERVCVAPLFKHRQTF